MHAAGASTLSGTALAMYFESGDYTGLHRCAGLEMRTAMCLTCTGAAAEKSAVGREAAFASHARRIAPKTRSVCACRYE